MLIIGLWIQFFTCYYEKYWSLKISKYKMHDILKKALIGYQLSLLGILIVLEKGTLNVSETNLFFFLIKKGFVLLVFQSCYV